MKCNACNENIDIKFKHAISTNTCPYCGEKLLSDAMFGFRIKITHILEVHEIDREKIESIATEIINTVLRAFSDDIKTQSPPVVVKLKKASIQDRKINLTSLKESDNDIEAEVEEEVNYNPSDPDDPNNPENQEFLKEIGWNDVENVPSKPKPKTSPIVKKLPTPIQRIDPRG